MVNGKTRLCTVMVVLALAAGIAGSPRAQSILSRHQCYTEFQGNAIRGVLQVERWEHYDTHRIYGNFRDAQGNLIELEVLTNQPGGVGGMWFNSARHREQHIQLTLLNDGFVIYAEDGNAARFHCR